jgi:hypothetical protein
MSDFSLEMLTEGIRQRHVSTANRALVEKWNRTGLLRGLDGVHRENMARLLENQASQVLRESSSVSTGGGALTSSGDLRGFTNVAFPIVRRVFGGLIANELVSIQPMSLPSGLLFYLDYTRGTNVGGADAAFTHPAGKSIYGDKTGKGIAEGIEATGGLYDLAAQSYTRVHEVHNLAVNFELAGHYDSSDAPDGGSIPTPVDYDLVRTTRLLQFDPQIIAAIDDGTTTFSLVAVPTYPFAANLDKTAIKEIGLLNDAGNGAVTNGLSVVPAAFQDSQNLFNVRRLNLLGVIELSTAKFTVDPFVDPTLNTATQRAAILMVVVGTPSGPTAGPSFRISYPIGDAFNSTADDGTSLVIPSFESDFGGTSGVPSPEIPEIDIKVEAVPVVATTRKLRARWSPELAQDLNAYHSLDAEVELTQILSEQIALEIDREILNDLLTQATAANYYWSRSPGEFVDKTSGRKLSAGGGVPPVFRGTVREWYETLTETIIDVANQIHRKTLRGSANFIVVGPDVATILESSVMYKPNYALDGSGQVGAMTIGAEKVGSLSNRFTVYKDPYFPRNKVLVGFKGGSYLESGYVYAPYVPLIVTPTIFAPEDFTPRKGVMTRYGKKMVRADFFGTVTCLDMNVI